MNESQLREARGEVIEATCNLEVMINALISMRYLRKVEKNFIQDVLCNDQCTLGLKRSILERWVALAEEKHGKEDPTVKLERARIQDINRLMRIRNIFAHTSPAWTDLGDGGHKDYAPDPKRPGSAIDYENCIEEFHSLEPAVNRWLMEKYETMSGLKRLDPPDTWTDHDSGASQHS